ncbi:DUF883 family protein [Minwuia sp.]|uniref:DUF883 family protein n=1 Tax=Minwuia sp. TaxID=2493630 RepID=UPI003A902363
MATQTTTNGKSGSADAKVTSEDLREDFEKLRSDMATLVAQVAEMSRAKVSDTAHTAKETAKAKASEAAHRAEEGYEMGRGWVTEQASNRPFATIGIAVLVGILIGRSLRR